MISPNESNIQTVQQSATPAQHSKPMKTYADFGLMRSLWQLWFALNERKKAVNNMSVLFDQLRQDEIRMEQTLGKPIENLRILEIGPGQGMERSRYLGIKNDVVGVDLDVISNGSDFDRYIQMIKVNGFGRFAKSFGRRLLIGQINEAAWIKAIGSDQYRDPQLIQGDICECAPETEAFDLVVSWSVFEHLPDPVRALKNVIQALKPRGGFYIRIHIFTSINGSHDMRAFTGREDKLPLWGHLRPTTANQIFPSSYLNRWRLPQWRRLFADLAPGTREYLESYDYREKYGPLLDQNLRYELKDYTNEELFTVDAIYFWQKP